MQTKPSSQFVDSRTSFRLSLHAAVLILATSGAVTAAQHAQAAPVTLGAAGSFGVLAGSTVTNTGSSTVFGNVGVAPGTSITGFPPGLIVGGSQHANDALAIQAQTDLTTAYNVIAGETSTHVLTGQNLGAMTLTPGVYFFASAAQLTGALTLDAQGDPNARFDFQIGSTLTTAASSSVLLTNSAMASDIFWQVGSSATIGTNSAFEGDILALTSISFTTGATDIGGKALARNGAVTLDTNVIGSSASAPEPSSFALLALAGVPLVGLVRRRAKSLVRR